MAYISVITVCKNSQNCIRDTIESVLMQKNTDYEYWIVDGESTDGTVDIIREYSDRLNLISEKDSGISEAFNKGIRNANGTYLIFLNSGDLFKDDSTLNYVENKLKSSDADIYSFNVEMTNGSKWFNESNEAYFKWEKSIIPHQGTFIKKKVFEKVGMFDTGIRVRMDYDFFKRCYLADCTYMSDMREIVSYDMNGISSKDLFNAKKEGLAIRLLYSDVIEDDLYSDLIELILCDEQTKNHDLKEWAENIQNKESKEVSLRKMYEKYFWCFNKWMYLRNHGIFVLNHPDLCDKRIAVYGFGKLGKRLIEDIKESGNNIEFAVDKNADDLFTTFDVYTGNDQLPQCDVIIVSLIYEYENIEKKLSEVFQGRIVSLETIIDDLWRNIWENV